jgi:hypothetical protein
MDTEQETEQAIVKGADKTDGSDRDLVHGDGGTIDLPIRSTDHHPATTSRYRCPRQPLIRPGGNVGKAR